MQDVAHDSHSIEQARQASMIRLAWSLFSMLYIVFLICHYRMAMTNSQVLLFHQIQPTFRTFTRLVWFHTWVHRAYIAVHRFVLFCSDFSSFYCLFLKNSATHWTFSFFTELDYPMLRAGIIHWIGALFCFDGRRCLRLRLALCQDYRTTHKYSKYHREKKWFHNS